MYELITPITQFIYIINYNAIYHSEHLTAITVEVLLQSTPLHPGRIGPGPAPGVHITVMLLSPTAVTLGVEGVCAGRRHFSPGQRWGDAAIAVIGGLKSAAHVRYGNIFIACGYY